MAAPNVSHQENGSSEFLVNTEANDIAAAIAASLDTPQGIPGTHVQGSSWWSPKTDEEWATYFRQVSAEEEAANLSM